MTDDDRARELWELGTKRRSKDQVEEAVNLFEQSIVVKPTAEGHTFRGWALSHLGRLDEATEDCKQAIQLDPDFGNPYNDIGVYLMQKGKFDEAIPWLGKAKQARRYEPRQFPFMNLGRVYLKQGRWWDALREFEGAVQAAPGDVHAAKTLHQLRGQLN